MSEIQLSSYQPDYYKTSELMRAINAALEAELLRLLHAADAVRREANPATAEESIGAWERSVGLPENNCLTPEQRRSRILARRRQFGSMTPNRLASIISSYVKGGAEIIEDISNYAIQVRFINTLGVPDNIQSIMAQVEQLKPAHIGVAYIYTYRTWGDLKKEAKTWGELRASGASWKAVREESAL